MQRSRAWPVVPIRALDLADGGRLRGSSPPALFVGRFGYPKVSVGPLLPPEVGDTARYDAPESWLGLTLPDIVRMRVNLVRGKFLANVTEPEARSPLLDATRELALARDSALAEAEFKKRPRGRPMSDFFAPPSGPSGSLTTFTVENRPWDVKLERVYYDTDHRAGPAVVDLHRADVPVTRIQRAFSLGTMGVARDRRLVPTRWSITAVDDTVGRALVAKNRDLPPVGEAQLHRYRFLGSTWRVLLLPGAHWRYELIEAWYPGTAFNQEGADVDMIATHEIGTPAAAAAERQRRGGARTLSGRRSGSDYALIGGCFYAARLAIQEHFQKMRRFGGAVVLRECDSGSYLPLGVWEVREAVREALRQPAQAFHDVGEAARVAISELALPRAMWMGHSAILRGETAQQRLAL